MDLDLQYLENVRIAKIQARWSLLIKDWRHRRIIDVSPQAEADIMRWVLFGNCASKTPIQPTPPA